MPSTTKTDTITVALVGNPNTGKSTLFNALAGVRQRVGNYPGVTVEKKIGRVTIDGMAMTLIDLPGTYSLAPRSPDEMVAVDVLLGRRDDTDSPDAILCIVDASNLERNLYLVSQVLELNRPCVIALNMVDVAAEKKIELDVDQLRERLGVPIVELQAHRKAGLPVLKKALCDVVNTQPATIPSPFPKKFQAQVTEIEEQIAQRGDQWPRYLVERLLLDTGGYLEQTLPASSDGIAGKVQAARQKLADAGLAVPAVEAISRYAWVGEILDGVITRPAERSATRTDRIDHFLTHKFWGTLTFVVLMLLVFQSIFAWAAPAMNLIEGLIGGLGEAVGTMLPSGALQSLVVDGVIGGVGAVLVFLPQIFILFLFIALLEDCGYMARAAYLMDKLMSRVGLSGKSFIPLLSSFACAIPGIMAARVIENPRDRLVTILIAPLMSCSARLPVYVLLIAAFIPDTRFLGGWMGLQGVTMFCMYLIGIVAAVFVALILNKTILKGETPPFVMELPSYKIPSLRTVLTRMLDRGWAFIRRAGTLIFAVTIVVWAAAYFPRNPEVETKMRAEIKAEREQLELQITEHRSNGQADAAARLSEQLTLFDSNVENQIAGGYMKNSILGRLGHFIEPVVRPLGWDWRIGCAAIASFPAREVVIGTLGVIYNLGEEQDEASQPLRDKLKSVTWPDSGRPVFNVPVALSIMVFFALCAQCAATLAVIKRETNRWRWPIFAFVYMTVLAYVGALLTYQIGRLFLT